MNYLLTEPKSHFLYRTRSLLFCHAILTHIPGQFFKTGSNQVFVFEGLRFRNTRPWGPWCTYQELYLFNRYKLSLKWLFNYPSQPPAPFSTKFTCQRCSQKPHTRSSCLVKHFFNRFFFCHPLPHQFSNNLRIKLHSRRHHRSYTFSKKNYCSRFELTFENSRFYLHIIQP